MPPPSKILALPAEVIEELDTRLRATNFSDYKGHEVWLRELGHQVGHSIIHAYAVRHRQRIKAGIKRGSNAQLAGGIKAADQRIECLKVAAALAPTARPEDVKDQAESFFSWATRE